MYFRYHLVSDGRETHGTNRFQAAAREVPSDPCIHDGANHVGTSSRWWYLPSMYSPSHACQRCKDFKPQTTGEVFAETLRDQKALADAGLKKKPIKLTSDLYRIPRDGFREAGTSSPHNVYFPHLENGKFTLTAKSGMSLLQLSKEDRESLRIVEVVSKVAYGRYWTGPKEVDKYACNPLKVGVSTARFVSHDIVASLPSDTARAAFEYLLEHNTWYKLHYDEQHALVLRKAPEAEFRIKTFDLMIKRQGIECAAWPWLYPHTDMSDTGILTTYKHEHEDDSDLQVSIWLSY